MNYKKNKDKKDVTKNKEQSEKNNDDTKKEDYIKYRESRSSVYKKIGIQIGIVFFVALIAGVISGMYLSNNKYKVLEKQIQILNKKSNDENAVINYTEDFKTIDYKINSVIVGISSGNGDIVKDSFKNKNKSVCFNGIIIDADDKYVNILTKYDFISAGGILDSDIYVQLPKDEYSPILAQMLKNDENTGLAVIQIKKPDEYDLPVNNFTRTQPSIGEVVYSISNVFGEEKNYSDVKKGIVSSLNEIVKNSIIESESITCFSVDIGMDISNTMGILVNENGYILGLNYYQTGQFNTCYVLPIDTALSVADKLLDKKPVGYLGLPNVQVTDIDAQNTEGIEKGLYVFSIDSGYGAQLAGIQVGDVIVRIGDVYTNTDNSIKEVESKYPVGSKLDCQIVRDGELIPIVKIELKGKL